MTPASLRCVIQFLAWCVKGFCARLWVFSSALNMTVMRCTQAAHGNTERTIPTACTLPNGYILFSSHSLFIYLFACKAKNRLGPAAHRDCEYHFTPLALLSWRCNWNWFPLSWFSWLRKWLNIFLPFLLFPMLMSLKF